MKIENTNKRWMPAAVVLTIAALGGITISQHNRGLQATPEEPTPAEAAASSGSGADSPLPPNQASAPPLPLGTYGDDVIFVTEPTEHMKKVDEVAAQCLDILYKRLEARGFHVNSANDTHLYLEYPSHLDLSEDEDWSTVEIHDIDFERNGTMEVLIHFGPYHDIFYVKSVEEIADQAEQKILKNMQLLSEGKSIR